MIEGEKTTVLGELTSEEIDQVLHSEAIRRIGCFAFGRPYVLPITYAYDGVAVYAHSREGLKLRMMRSHPNVCFEVDRFDGLESLPTAHLRAGSLTRSCCPRKAC